MNVNGLSRNEATSVKLAEKMLRHPFFVPVLKAHFGGLSNLKKYMLNVTFDNVFAETMRTDAASIYGGNDNISSASETLGSLSAPIRIKGCFLQKLENMVNVF